MFATWWREFKSSSNFRRTFLLAFYTAMILLRTVLNREIWFDPLGKLLGGWGLYEDGQFTTESIENFMLFVPFSILLLWAFQKELLGESENIRFGKTVWEATKVVAVFSFMIEFTQLLFHRIVSNSLSRDRNHKCFSYHAIAEDYGELEDKLTKIEEQVSQEQMVELLMSVLTEKQKEILKKVYWEQKTHKQIASMYGMSRSSVSDAVHKALMKISRSFDENGEPR